ncbi:general secretion pathway protein GspK [Candidatus Sumerlaeota bacterium]|nr:general secretion pathway protein GspK [Candidatus Sumerlaeota bacterium]
MMGCLSRSRSTRGLALILTMWLVIVLVTMVYSLLWDVQVEIRLRRMAMDDLRAQWMARAGVAKAIADLSNDMAIERSEDNVPLDALGDVWAFDNDDKTDISLSDEDDAPTFTVRVVDAERLINLNTAPLEVLMGLFEVLGEDDETVTRRRAEAIIDWRDEDTDPASSLAEPGFQERRHWSEELRDEEGLDWEGTLHNGRFLTVEELLMVPGITPELFYGPGDDGGEAQRERHSRRGRSAEPGLGLRDCVTTLSNGQINLNTAIREVLGALAIAGIGSVADWENVADAIIEQRDGRREDDSDDDDPFLNVGELANVPVATGLQNCGVGLNVRSQNFVITSTGRAGSARHTIVCEVRRDWEVYVHNTMADLYGGGSNYATANLLRMPSQFIAEPTEDDQSSRGDRSAGGLLNQTVERAAVRIVTWVEN